MTEKSPERLSGLSYKEAFELLEYLYFKERSLSESHQFHVYKIRDHWFNEIKKGKLFEIRKDDRQFVPLEGDIVCLRTSIHHMFVKVTYVLLHEEAPDLVMGGSFIFGFEIICELQKQVSAWLAHELEMIDNSTAELCQFCGSESEIQRNAVGKCAHCGEELFPCSACNCINSCSWVEESQSCDFFKHAKKTEKSGAGNDA